MSTAADKSADKSADKWYRHAERIETYLRSVIVETRAGRGVHLWPRRKRLRFASLCGQFAGQMTAIVEHVEELHGPLPAPRRVHWTKFLGPLPEGAKLVTRRSRWGNPFRADEHGLARCLELYRAHVLERLATDPDWLEPLRGFDLACACPEGQPCHGDVLIELANR